MRYSAAALVLTAGLLVSAASAAMASARPAPQEPVIRLTWHATPAGYYTMTDGRYFVAAPLDVSGPTTVTDSRTGAHFDLRQPPGAGGDCLPEVAGAGLIADSCQSGGGASGTAPAWSVWIFDIATRTWTQAAAPAGGLGDYGPTAVGTDWVVLGGYGTGVEAPEYLNWHTGQVLPQTSTLSLPDLDGPGNPTRPACSDLATPDFLSLMNSDLAVMDYLSDGPRPSDAVYVQNCHDGAARTLAEHTAGPVGDGSIVLWQSLGSGPRPRLPGWLNGVDLSRDVSFRVSRAPGEGDSVPESLTGRLLTDYDDDSERSYWAVLPALAGRPAIIERPAPRRIPYLRLRYHALPAGAQAPETDGRYVFVPVGSQTDAAVTLLDMRTRQPVTIPPPPDTGCTPALLGAGQFVDTCDPAGVDSDGADDTSVWIYTLAHRSWHEFVRDEGGSLVAIGRYWIELEFTEGDDEHATSSIAYDNLTTGRQVDPGGNRDLNRPTLPHLPDCAHMSGGDFEQWVAPERLALLDAIPGEVTDPDILYLQRCGSTHRQTLDVGTYPSTMVGFPFVVWADDRTNRYLDGYDVSTHRSFRFNFAGGSDTGTWTPLFVVGRRVYLGGLNRFFYATLPPGV